MNNLIDASLNKSRTVLLALVMILICGAVAFRDIPKESSPDINIPIINVAVDLRGISPEDSERLLIKPIEQKLRTVEGVKEMRSSAFSGGANIVLEFDAGFDADNAILDVREKVDEAKPELPEEADEPNVTEVNFSLFPVISVILSGDVPERTLLRLAKDLRDEIEGINTVLEAEIGGNREEQLEVIIDPLLLESYGITNSEILSRVKNFNKLIAAGSIESGKGQFDVKVPGLFKDARDVLSMPITISGEAIIRIRDIAEIRSTFEDPTSFARVNGKRAVTLDIKKRSGTNIIETIERVRETVAQYTRDWPASIKISYSGDQSENIRVMLSDLQNNVISAILLVMIVVLAALGLRSAGLVGVSIPGSFLAGILVIYALGLTINIVVLFSLILSVGMLVDGAIVLTEYADRRLGEGLTPQKAYGMAAKRMAWPIIASTATTLAAFLPLLFWPGVVGEFMKYMPITLIATLSASLLMALIFVPVLGAVITKQRKISPENQGKEQPDDPISDSKFTRFYLSVLESTLKKPGIVLGLSILVLIVVYSVYGMYGKGVEFFPEIEPDRAKLQIHARGNLSIYEKDDLVKEVEQVVLELVEEKKEIKTIYSRSGITGQSEEAEDIIGQIQLEFEQWQKRRSATVILNDILERSSKIVGITVEARKAEEGPSVGKPIQIQLSSRYTEKLREAAKTIISGMEKIDGFTSVEDGLPIPGIEWQLEIDRAQAAKYGADVSFVGAAVQLVTNGFQFSSYRPDYTEQEVAIVARYPEKYRTIRQLDNIRITTQQGNVPISNFVTRSAQQKVGTINRTDATKTITIKADVEEGILPNDKVVELTKWLEGVKIDPQVSIKFKGEDQEQKEAGDFLSKAFSVALFIMAIILVTQFNSFYSAFLILSAVIMSTVGVLIGLMIIGQPFGIVMSGVGVIALAGIVVNNNIVLIDTFDTFYKEVGDAKTAILLTGAQRLRPVLLTTVTTILGLMPMVLQINIDFVSRYVSVGAPSTQWWVQLATGIVFGLTFATILTLIVTPCCLMIKANIRQWKERKFKEKA